MRIVSTLSFTRSAGFAYTGSTVWSGGRTAFDKNPVVAGCGFAAFIKIVFLLSLRNVSAPCVSDTTIDAFAVLAERFVARTGVNLPDAVFITDLMRKAVAAIRIGHAFSTLQHAAYFGTHPFHTFAVRFNRPLSAAAFVYRPVAGTVFTAHQFAFGLAVFTTTFSAGTVRSYAILAVPHAIGTALEPPVALTILRIWNTLHAALADYAQRSVVFTLFQQFPVAFRIAELIFAFNATHAVRLATIAATHYRIADLTAFAVVVISVVYTTDVFHTLILGTIDSIGAYYRSCHTLPCLAGVVLGTYVTVIAYAVVVKVAPGIGALRWNTGLTVVAAFKCVFRKAGALNQTVTSLEFEHTLRAVIAVVRTGQVIITANLIFFRVAVLLLISISRSIAIRFDRISVKAAVIGITIYRNAFAVVTDVSVAAIVIAVTAGFVATLTAVFFTVTGFRVAPQSRRTVVAGKTDNRTAVGVAALFSGGTVIAGNKSKTQQRIQEN